MADDNQNLDDKQGDGNGNNEDKGNDDKGSVTPPKTGESFTKAEVETMIAEAITGIKGKLDNAFAQRDEALNKAAELEQQKKDADIQRLKDEGKHSEALEAELAEAKAKIQALSGRNTELSRDNDVRNALRSLEFRSDSAYRMAENEIKGQLVQNDKGEWVHSNGSSISDYVSTFAGNEANEFLFKAKRNSGSGTSDVKPPSGDTKPKSLYQMSQEDVLKMAEEGTLPNQQ